MAKYGCCCTYLLLTDVRFPHPPPRTVWLPCEQRNELSTLTLLSALVAVPTVRIDGGDPEMYVESGSSVVLRCHISNWLQKPQIVFW